MLGTFGRPPVQRTEPGGKLQLGMASVAKRAFPAVLTATKVNRSGFLRGVGRGTHPASLVRSVAKRLVLAQPTRTPVIGFS